MPSYDIRHPARREDHDDAMCYDFAISKTTMTTTTASSRTNDDPAFCRRARRRIRRSGDEFFCNGNSGMHHTEEDRRAFVAAHHALNGDECRYPTPRGGDPHPRVVGTTAGRVRPEYDIEYDLELAERDGDDIVDKGGGGDGVGGGACTTGGGGERPVYRSSLAMSGG